MKLSLNKFALSTRFSALFWLTSVHASSRQFIDKITEDLKAQISNTLFGQTPSCEQPDSYGVFFEDPERIKVEITAPSRGLQNEFDVVAIWKLRK